MATRNVVLTERQSKLVDRLVSSGRYQNASEALRAGLRLIEREEVELTELRARLATGLGQASAHRNRTSAPLLYNDSAKSYPNR